MSWPLAIPLGGPDPQSYLRLLRRLMPDGYSQDPDGPRVTELEAYALALWLGRQCIDRAFAQAYPDRAMELLEEWERAYDLPNDAARTLAERQQRLRAAELAIAGAARSRITDALREVAPSAIVNANSVAQVQAAAALDEMIWHVGVQLDASEFDTPAVRRAAARVLHRMLPARLHRVPEYVGRDAPQAPADAELPFYVAEGATWGGPEILGRAVLQRQDATARAVREPTNRFREFAGLVRLEAADLNALQALTLMRPCTGAGVLDSFANAGIDQAIRHFAVAAATGGETVVDSSIDWRNRHVLVALQYSSDDIRPGEADDDSVTRTRAINFFSTTSGSFGVSIATNLSVGANSTTGALRVSNNTGSTVYLVGTVIATPDVAAAKGAFLDFEDGDDLSALNQTFWANLTDAALPRPASEVAGSWSHPGPGALMRLGWVAGTEEDTPYVLDREADWRDRMIAVACLLVSPVRYGQLFRGPVYPGAPDDDATSNAFEGMSEEALSAGYTGTGIADGTLSSGYRVAVGTFAWVYASDTDGSLRIVRTVGGADPMSLVVLVIASEPLGVRATPAPASPSLAVVDATQIEPHILNGFQDRALLGQMRDGATANDCFPLGPKLDAGGIPEIWTRTIDPSVGAVLRRQPVAGQVWRFFYASCAPAVGGNEVVLDDTIDWRDRILFGAGRRSNAAGAPLTNSGLPWNVARYTGPGETGAPVSGRGYGLRLTSGLLIRARASDGALVLRNDGVSTQYVSGIVCASFQLGPRSS